MEEFFINQIFKIGIFSLLFFADLMITFFFMVRYKQKFPEDSKWQDMEFNFFLRNLWKEFGLYKGTFFGVIIIYPLFFLAIYLVSDNFFLGTIFGMYIMIFFFHVLNFKTLMTKDGL